MNKNLLYESIPIAIGRRGVKSTIMRLKKCKDMITQKQPGFISRESGFSNENNEVLVIVKWKTEADANVSMQKFMEDKSVVDFVNMIEANTMKMKRYNVE